MKHSYPNRANVAMGRRKRLWLLFCGLIVGLFSLEGQTDSISSTPADWVNPFIGTAKGGNVFPGADYPFGMAQWSPDTSPKPGGYDYNSKTATGFSLTHFSGRGHYGWGDFPFLPTLEAINQSPGVNWPHYAVTFAHAGEKASAGYYGVLLDNKIKVELTATLHGGLGRFTFPANAPTGTILINSGGSRNADQAGTQIELRDGQTVTGVAVSSITTIHYKVYFAARFDRPAQSAGTWNGAALTPGKGKNEGTKTGAYLTFANDGNHSVQVRVGLSFVSVENALANLTGELGEHNFEQTRLAARQAWNDFFAKIKITEESPEKKTIFYSNLYHSLLHPNVFSDANGQYLGFDDQIHQLAAGEAQFENISSWDGWRNQFPLQALIAPRQARDIIRSLLRDAQQDPGGGMPRWEQANQNSGGMVGDSPAIFVADAYAYGVRDFDVEAAFAILTKAATDPNVKSGGFPVREHLEEYRKSGVVSERYGASIVLEYCNDDFALSRLAQQLGKTDLAAYYLKAAQNWKNLYNPALGYIVPKSREGAFLANYKLGTDVGFKEGSAQQYTWLVPFNFRGLVNLMGGNPAAIAKLQRLFTKYKGGYGEYANMGNEPGNTCPWAYDFVGAPYLAQKTTREVVLQLYTNTPGGLPGNDDGGAMSSWCVFAALGIFPEIPGVPGFVVGSPLYKQATIVLPSGGLLKINAPAAADRACYVRSLSIKEANYASPWIPWDLVKDGAHLDFAMQTKPNVQWGSDPVNAPPSFDVE